jgi:hypothetical protein
MPRGGAARLSGAAPKAVAAGRGDTNIPPMKPHPPGAVASLVFGILAILAWFVPLAGMLMGMLAIAASRRAGSALADGSDAFQPGGLHTAGLVTGIIGLVLSSLAMLVGMAFMSLVGAAIAAAGGHQPPAQPPVLLW